MAELQRHGDLSAVKLIAHFCSMVSIEATMQKERRFNALVMAGFSQISISCWPTNNWL
jgi:hypothetical protein